MTSLTPLLLRHYPTTMSALPSAMTSLTPLLWRHYPFYSDVTNPLYYDVTTPSTLTSQIRWRRFIPRCLSIYSTQPRPLQTVYVIMLPCVSRSGNCIRFPQPRPPPTPRVRQSLSVATITTRSQSLLLPPTACVGGLMTVWGMPVRTMPRVLMLCAPTHVRARRIFWGLIVKVPTLVSPIRVPKAARVKGQARYS